MNLTTGGAVNGYGECSFTCGSLDIFPQIRELCGNQIRKNTHKGGAKTLCPICWRPQEFTSFLYRHVKKMHPETFYLFTEISNAATETAHSGRDAVLIANNYNGALKTRDVLTMRHTPDHGKSRKNKMPEVDASQMILSSMENLFYNCGASLEIPCEENYESDDGLLEKKRNKITRRKAYLEKADFFPTEKARLCEEIQQKETSSKKKSPAKFHNSSVENGVVARNKRGKFDSWNLKRIEQATCVHNLSLKTSDQPGLLTRLYIQGLGNMRHETIGCMYNQEEKTKINNPVPKLWGDPNPIPILIAPFLEDNNVNSIDLSGEVEIEGGSKRPIRQSLSNHTLSPRKKGNTLSLELTIEDITAFPFRWRDEVITQPEETCIMNAQPIKRTARKRNTTYKQP